MSRNDKESIHLDRFKNILISNKVKILILGGGRAAEIKSRSFINKKMDITLYSQSIKSEYIKRMIRENKIDIMETFKYSYLQEFHIIVIATDDDIFNKNIRKKCLEMNKLFLLCSNWKEGNIILSNEFRTKSLNISLNTEAFSPLTSKFIINKLKKELEEYDEFILYVLQLREIIKKRGDSNRLLEIMNFVNTDDFYYIYKKKKADLILKLFYGADIFENKSRN